MDEHAFDRHEKLVKKVEGHEWDDLKKEAKSSRFKFGRSKGNVGVICNGRGLAMTTMDALEKYQGDMANYVAVQGGAAALDMHRAISIVTKDAHVKGLYINIFGGLTRCDAVAKGVLEVMLRKRIDMPVVIRFAGTNAKEAKKMIANTTLIATDSVEDGAKKILQMIRAAY